jgi:tRNA-(ms[2]io[6]A)-hydroxylase
VTILAAATPAAWIDAACERWDELLIDHANCEKKAASSALALLFAYPEDCALGASLSRLAREELRHFEQVAQMMQRLQVSFVRQKPGRYAARLRGALRSHEPVRKLDVLLGAALIEARSCERFGLLAPRLPAPLGAFYAGLQQAEARHFELYLRLAREAGAAADAADAAGAAGAPADQPSWRARLAQLAAVEAELITTPDEQLRFHSGPPRA